MIVASASFRCHEDGRVVPDVWQDPEATDAGNRNARNIERLVRLTMRATAEIRERIDDLLDAAERAESSTASSGARPVPPSRRTASADRAGTSSNTNHKEP